MHILLLIYKRNWHLKEKKSNIFFIIIIIFFDAEISYRRLEEDGYFTVGKQKEIKMCES